MTTTSIDHLLSITLPRGRFPEVTERVCTAEQNDAWHSENWRLRVARGDLDRGDDPMPTIPFVLKD
jgi:hypothetical protein